MTSTTFSLRRSEVVGMTRLSGGSGMGIVLMPKTVNIATPQTGARVRNYGPRQPGGLDSGTNFPTRTIARYRAAWPLRAVEPPESGALMDHALDGNERTWNPKAPRRLNRRHRAREAGALLLTTIVAGDFQKAQRGRRAELIAHRAHLVAEAANKADDREAAPRSEQAIVQPNPRVRPP